MARVPLARAEFPKILAVGAGGVVARPGPEDIFAGLGIEKHEA